MHENQRDCKEEKMCSSELRVTEQPTELKSPGFDDGKTFTQDLTTPSTTPGTVPVVLHLIECVISHLIYDIFYIRFNISICTFYDRSARAG